MKIYLYSTQYIQFGASLKMRLFVKKICLFTLTFVLLGGVLSSITLKYYKSRIDVKLAPNITTLILGHSHTVRAYNDTLIKNSKNLASLGEPYFYTFVKAREIIEQNPQIETVFIECSNNQFIKHMDTWIWGKSLKNKLCKYGSFLGRHEIEIILQKNPVNLIRSLASLIKHYSYSIIQGDYRPLETFGGFSSDDKALNKEPEIFRNKPISFDSSPVNIAYLVKLIDYLKTRGKKVVLIRTPTREAYFNFYSEHRFQEILSNHFNQEIFYDFAKLKLHYTRFSDLQHMNQNGAKEFSLWFNELVQNKEVNSKNQQSFIDQSIKEFNRFKQ